ncbi:hypothetical protein E8E12_000742 [Didymella heteroderae]|uniref:Uncharacterized protein n=1 Tax=Didymella heteroderae TaxID=1769908 RepID=A0A9P4WFJ3_9PLEO|nr:hypothetical protein E8E12_000742 [Didymella heteroderae]
MSKQPGYQNSGYKLFDAGFASFTQLSKGRLSEWPEVERKALYDTFRLGFDSLQDELEDARKNGKQVFIKEHALLLSGPDKFFSHVYGQDEVDALVLKERGAPDSSHTNPTSLPDSLLLSVRPIFQIRHPILMFPSMVRAEQKAYGLGAIRPRDPILAVTLTLRHSRALYDWYRSQAGDVHPQVIDADDIINDRDAVSHVCKAVGLSPDAVQYEWETREEMDPKRAVFLSTINASKGIIPGLAARGLDFELEKTKWKTEFGDEDGEDIAKFVLDAMPDYVYLLNERTYIST